MADKNIKEIHQVCFNAITLIYSTFKVLNIFLKMHAYIFFRIFQFLLNHNLESTAEALIQETSKMGFQNLECKLGVSTNLYAQLMLCYNTGNYTTFFQVKSYLYNSVRCKL